MVDGNFAIEHIRAELLSLLIKIHYFETIEESEKALKQLIVQLDDIQFAFNIYKRQIRLDLEPVNILEVRDQTLHKIYKESSYKNIQLISKDKFIKPVLASRSSLSKSLESMIYSIIDCQVQDLQRVEIEISRRAEAVHLGVYRDGFFLNASLLKQVRNNLQQSSRPASNMSPFSTTNLFIADTLLTAMGFNLKTSISNRRRGIATSLPLSNQLELIRK